MLKWLPVTIALLTVLAGCASNRSDASATAGSQSAEGAIFKFEPTRKATIFSRVPLSAGDELIISVSGLKDSEVLMLNRCGEPCDTARLIRQWRRQDFGASESYKVTLRESGRYYFWIQRRLDSGEVGPVFGDFETADGEKLIFQFVSGTSLSIVPPHRAIPSDARTTLRE